MVTMSKIRTLLLLSFASVSVVANDSDISDFKHRIEQGEQSREYSKSLLSHKNLLDVVQQEERDKSNELSYINSSSSSALTTPKTVEVPKGEYESGASTSKPTRQDKTISEAEYTQTEGAGNNNGHLPNENGSEAARQKTNTTKSSPRFHQENDYGYQREDDPYDDSDYEDLDPLLNKRRGKIANNIKQVSPKTAAVKFGIPIGSSIEVKLINGANNIQPGYVVFEVLESVEGYLETLPAKSKLFGKPQTVIGDDRLYVEVLKGITPFNDEFEMSAFVVGVDERPGLLATVRNDGKSLKRASSDTLFTAATEITEAIAGQSVPVVAGKEGLKTLMDEKRGESENENGRPAYIVEAAIQSAKLSVVETF